MKRHRHTRTYVHTARTARLAFRLLVALALALICRPLHAQQRIEMVDGAEAASQEVIVKLRTAARSSLLLDLRAAHNLDVVHEVGGAGALRLHSRTKNVAELMDQLAARGDVEYVEPNFVVHTVALPNDPSLGALWGLSDIKATAAWAISTGSTQNVVGVIDTGIDYTHPDLAPNVWSAPTSFTVNIAGQSITCPPGSHGFNAITNSCDPRDDQYHGTHVSGTIGAVGNNALGVVGVNWTGSIMGAKFLDADGSGYISNAINAIEFTVQAKAAFASSGAANVRVLSNSWGCPPGACFSQAVLDEINRANANNMLFVAAAGNASSNNDTVPTYPASYAAPNVIAVAATNQQDALASFSNYGSGSVHLAAPGVSILSTYPNNQYQYLQGTSMATPHVSGAAALVLSYCSFNTAQLKANLLSTVDPIASLAGRTVTGGRLNVQRALQACFCANSPANPAHGSYPSCTNARSGGTCPLTCSSGYTKTGDAVCTNGTWSTPSCAANCASAPPDPANGTYASCTNTASGGRCGLTCKAGYQKSADALCTDGTWSTETCTYTFCATPQSTAMIGNAYLDSSCCNHDADTTVVFAQPAEHHCITEIDGWGNLLDQVCFPGTAPCINNGNTEWYSPPLQAQQVQCNCIQGLCGGTGCCDNRHIGCAVYGWDETVPCDTQPPAVANGTYAASCVGTGSGGTCPLTCNPGYAKTGDAVCTNGTWSTPSCGLACSASPSNPAHGTYASCANTPTGGTCSLTCNSSYTKSGDALCTNGTWSTQTCTHNYCTTPQSSAMIGNAYLDSSCCNHDAGAGVAFGQPAAHHCITEIDGWGNLLDQVCFPGTAPCINNGNTEWYSPPLQAQQVQCNCIQGLCGGTGCCDNRHIGCAVYGWDEAVCGNGIVESGEECDDSNATSGDGCSDSCQIETGWSCDGRPSTCTSTCIATARVQLIGSTGDGSHALLYPDEALAVDASGNIIVGGANSNNAFKITPGGAVSQIISSAGDGTHPVSGGIQSAAVDGSGNVYLGADYGSGVFKVTPGGLITQIIGSAGDGTHALSRALAIAVDGGGNVYVAGYGSGNAFEIAPSGSVTQIISGTGDSTHGLSNPIGIAVDSGGNVYVSGSGSNNVFKIAGGGVITQLIDSTGDGTHALSHPHGLAVDSSGYVYVAGQTSNNVFKIVPGSGIIPATITQIMDSTGDGVHGISSLNALAADGSGNVYVPGYGSNNVLQITSGGAVRQVIDGTGDGTHPLSRPVGVAIHGSLVYVSGTASNNVFRVPAGICGLGQPCTNSNQCLSHSCVGGVCSISGNGTIESGEQCDDGNTISGDGCSATGQVESGYTCAGQPSVCSLASCPANASGAPNCACNNGYQGSLTWTGTSWVGTCGVVAGQPCTTAVQCSSGFCVDGVCCNSACAGGVNDCQACSVAAGGSVDGSCLPSTGNPCDDSNACTQPDVCQGGACVGSNRVLCVPLDSCHTAGTCDPNTGTCSNPATPDGGACDNGDGCLGDTCQSGTCQPVPCPDVDAVVLPLKPLNVTVPGGAATATKTLKMTVRNAGTVDQVIKLSADVTQCATVAVGTPDFGLGSDSITVPAGASITARVALTINRATVSSFNFKAPARCTILFVASAVVAGGSNDQTPDNNAVDVEVNIIDRNDPQQTTRHETLVASAKPVSLTIPLHASGVTKTFQASIGNGDYKPTPETPGDAISLDATRNCAGLTLSPPICDKTTSSSTATVKGGAKKSCKFTASFAASQISTPNRLSPQRCRVTLNAVGPSQPDQDPSNNSTEMTIDVIDKND